MDTFTNDDEDVVNYDGELTSIFASPSVNLNDDSSSLFFSTQEQEGIDKKNEEDSCNCFPFNYMSESDRPTANTNEIDQTISDGDPQTNESTTLNNVDNFISTVKPVSLVFDSEIYKQTQLEDKSTKKKTISQKGNRRDYCPFEVTSKEPKRDRRDYGLLKVKPRVCKFIKKILNYYGRSCKLTFYAPDATSFTQNINYDDNGKWLNWTVRRIITTYDFKGTKNKLTLMKMEQCEKSKNFDYVNNFLSLTFEKVIEIYAKSKQYESDLSKLDEIDQKIFKELLNGKYENTFIYMMKYVKGNKKKQK